MQCHCGHCGAELRWNGNYWEGCPHAPDSSLGARMAREWLEEQKEPEEDE